MLVDVSKLKFILFGLLFLSSKLAANPPSHLEYFSKVNKNITSDELSQADKLRLETIGSIQVLIKDKFVSKVQMTELYLRLGELYAERHDYLRHLELRQFEMAYDQWKKSPQAFKEPVLNHQKSKEELARSANVYRKLVNDFKENPRRDEAVYALAKILALLENEQSLKYFKLLTSEYKNSSLLPDAHLAMADYFFDHHLIEKAIESYKAAAQFKEFRHYPYVVFKLGWSYYNREAKNQAEQANNYDLAIAAFKLVVKLGDQPTFISTHINLRNEALNDLVMVWADLEDTESAWAYLREANEPEHFNKLLERLASSYDLQGNYAKAIATYRRIFEEMPLRKLNLNSHLRILDLLKLTGDSSLIPAEAKIICKNYLHGSWHVAFNQNSDQYSETKAKIAESLHRLGTSLHEFGLKSKDDATLRVSSEIYQIFLGEDLDPSKSLLIEYYLADVKFELAEFQEAYQHYFSVAQKSQPKDEFYKDSSTNSIISAQKAIADFENSKEKENVDQRRQIDSQLIAAIDHFHLKFPTEPENSGLLFLAAKIIFENDGQEFPRLRFETIVQSWPSSEEAIMASQAILEQLKTKKDWIGIKSWVDENHKRFLETSPTLARKIMEFYKRSLFSKAKDEENKGEYREAAQTYLLAFKIFGGEAGGDEILYNAIINFYKGKDVSLGIKTSAEFVAKYRSSPLTNNILIDKAQAGESMGLFEAAAEDYKQFAIMFAKDPKAPDATLNAAIIFQSLERLDEARWHYEKIIRSYPKSRHADRARTRLVEVLCQLGKYGDAVNILEGSINEASSTEAKLTIKAKVAEIKFRHLGVKSWQTDFLELKKFLIKSEVDAPTARKIVAEMAFGLLDTKISHFKKIEFSNPKRLTADLKSAQETLEGLAKEIRSVIQLRDQNTTIASYYELGVLHEQFARNLLKASSPQNFGPNEILDFRTDLENLSNPLKEQALHFYKTSFELSQNAETVSIWAQQAFNKVAEIDALKYPSVNEEILSASYLSYPLLETPR